MSNGQTLTIQQAQNGVPSAPMQNITHWPLVQGVVRKCQRRVLIDPPTSFAQRVFTAIGSVPTKWTLQKTIVGPDRAVQDTAWRTHQERVKLATISLKYVQLREALDRAPTLKEFGLGSFYYLAPVLDPSLTAKWASQTSARTTTTYEDMKTRVKDAGPAWESYAPIERWNASPCSA